MLLEEPPAQASVTPLPTNLLHGMPLAATRTTGASRSQSQETEPDQEDDQELWGRHSTSRLLTNDPRKNQRPLLQPTCLQTRIPPRQSLPKSKSPKCPNHQLIPTVLLLVFVALSFGQSISKTFCLLLPDLTSVPLFPPCSLALIRTYFTKGIYWRTSQGYYAHRRRRSIQIIWTAQRCISGQGCGRELPGLRICHHRHDEKGLVKVPGTVQRREVEGPCFED